MKFTFILRTYSMDRYIVVKASNFSNANKKATRIAREVTKDKEAFLLTKEIEDL